MPHAPTPKNAIQNTQLSIDLSVSNAGTFSVPKYMNQASTLDLASRGVTVEANISNVTPRIGSDFTIHIQYRRIPLPNNPYQAVEKPTSLTDFFNILVLLPWSVTKRSDSSQYSPCQIHGNIRHCRMSVMAEDLKEFAADRQEY